MNYKIINFLVCEDVRREENGKHILIGVYSQKILVFKPLPITLPKLCFFFHMSIDESGEFPINFSVVEPNGTELASTEGHITFTEAGPGAFTVPYSPFQLPSEGDYSVRLKIDGQRTRKIGEFAVEFQREKRALR